MPNIVTAKDVYDLAGLSVDHELIARAQLVVATAAEFPLSDAAKFATLSAGDQYHLSTAVVWQVVYLDKHPDALAGDYLANVQSASANGASITLRDGVDGTLAGLAERELAALSWRRKAVTVKTLRPYSRAAQRGPQPDPWRPL